MIWWHFDIFFYKFDIIMYIVIKCQIYTYWFSPFVFWNAFFLIDNKDPDILSDHLYLYLIYEIISFESEFYRFFFTKYYSILKEKCIICYLPDLSNRYILCKNALIIQLEIVFLVPKYWKRHHLLDKYMQK